MIGIVLGCSDVLFVEILGIGGTFLRAASYLIGRDSTA